MNYRAFISYSHKDEAFARWLHRQIEGWRVPRDLIGRETAYGKIPSSIRPVFRDRDDFSGGSSLKQATLNALEASEALIVVCSPDAARSAYVDEEIRLFKELGRSAQVIAIIAAGDPAAGDCFPSWLRREPGAADPVEPIAADARDVGDGRRRAAAKVVAGLLGVPFDEIIRRSERDRRARMALLAGAGAGAFVFATAFSSYALYQSYQAAVVIDKSVFSIGGLIQSTDGLPDDGDSASIRREMLREQCDLMDGLASGRSTIGVQEANICFFERTKASLANQPPEQLLKTLCAARDELQAAIAPKAKPSHEESRALARLLQRTYQEIAAHPDSAGKCNPGTSNADDHLRYLVDELAALGGKRPDIDSLRRMHDQATWELIGRREAAGDWVDSSKLMQAAIELRRTQSAEPSSEHLHPASYDLGVYLRRLSWLKVAHLDDAKGAETIGREAVELWSTLSASNTDSREAAYQALLAYEVHGNALVAAERREEGIARLESARELAETLLPSLSADSESESRQAVEKELGYLNQRLGELKAG